MLYYVCKHSVFISIAVPWASVFKYKVDLCQVTSLILWTRSLHWKLYYQIDHLQWSSCLFSIFQNIFNDISQVQRKLLSFCSYMRKIFSVFRQLNKLLTISAHFILCFFTWAFCSQFSQCWRQRKKNRKFSFYSLKIDFIFFLCKKCLYFTWRSCHFSL